MRQMQGDESISPGIKGHPAQLQTQRLRCTNGPQALDKRGGERVRTRETAFTSVLDPSVVWISVWELWTEAAVWSVWLFKGKENTYVVSVGTCVFCHLSNFLVSVSLFLWRYAALKPAFCCSPNFFISSQMTENQPVRHHWTNLLETTLDIWSNIKNMLDLSCGASWNWHFA